MTIRILIADDHVLLRAGLRVLLNIEPDLEVVGEASDGLSAVSLAQTLQPDVILMDISMPGLSGIEATRQLHQKYPNINILILTIHEDDCLLEELIRIGASGFILKRALESELVDAIKAVARGDLYVHPAMTRALFLQQTSTVEPEPHDVLTPRELEVLRHIAAGHTNREIAEQLAISVRTVESHRANLMDKLDLRNRASLVRYAAQNNLLDLEESPYKAG